MSRRAAGVMPALLEAIVRAGDPGLTATQLARDVERHSHGALIVSAGGLYATLTRLVESGFALRREVGSAGALRVVYAATDAGRDRCRAVLAARRGEWEPGTIVQGLQGEYRIDRYYDYGSRAATYIGRALRVQPRLASVGLRVGMTVVIKSATIEVGTVTPAEARAEAGRLADRFRLELPALQRLNETSSVAKTFDWGERSLASPRDEVLSVPFVVQEKLVGTPLSKLMARDHPGGLSEAGDWFRRAAELARALVAIHERGTVYRNIFPHTIVIRRDGPAFADLGEAALALRDRAHGTSAFYLAPEMRSAALRPSRRADLYSLGGVLFYLATGRDPTFVHDWGDEELKAEVFDALMSSVHAIVRQNFGIADIISRCLRRSPETRVQTARDVLRDIQLFDPAPAPELLDTVKRVRARVRRIGASPGVFQSLAAIELTTLERKLDEIIDRDVVVSGGHDGIVTSLTGYLSSLRLGDTYFAVSVPQFWNSSNMGTEGRYLSMILEAARRGATLRRVFLLSPADRVRAATLHVMSAQIRAQKRLQTLKATGAAVGTMETSFQIMEAGEIEMAIRQGEHRGAWIRGDAVITLTPVYDAQGVARSVRIQQLDDRRVTDKWMARFLTGAIPVSEDWPHHRRWGTNSGGPAARR